MKAPMTDRTLGIAGCEGKFRDVRGKAQDEYIERCKKRKKEKLTPVPKFRVGDFIVFPMRYHTADYILIEVVDFSHSYGGHFVYFGIVTKVTHCNYSDRIGRLYCSDYHLPVPVPQESIKWIEDNS